MMMRIGKVTNIYPSTGKVKVVYDDEKSSSLPLAMLTMNQEYSMPAVGDKVVTMHMENGSSKGFVLGTYYGGGMQPKASGGYRKDFGGGVYVTVSGKVYRLDASKINIIAEGGAMELSANKEDAKLTLDTDTILEATSATVEAEDITLKCSYGTITVEDMMKRLERVEDTLGLPHTI